ncbi:DUF6916 family protein [Massilia glaciei]|uniref:DUF6916 domain-containing protein n=1 Tax=Massilia glaciei TaxID=1524097 RepID=A0A2U2HDG1_9BURK|nr:hypothetical protein [Massilia glaciei]PWF41058.1 hypothetical protein C7C56_025360 [Massilia glaciei]
MEYTLALFAPLVGTVFTVETQAGPVELVLLEAREMPRRGLPEQFRTPLSLIFEGGTAPALEQDNYYVDHPALGRATWTLVPVMPCAPSRRSGPARQYELGFS